jgi:hypothetical protein
MASRSNGGANVTAPELPRSRKSNQFYQLWIYADIDREIARSLSLARITVPLTLAGLRR